MHSLRFFVLFSSILASVTLGAATIGDKLEDGLGVSLPWQEGNINVRMANHRFQLYFLDADGEIIAPNVPMASIRYATYAAPYDYSFATFDLSPSGDSFISSRYVPPPNLYWVSIAFFKKENGKTINLKTFDPVQLSQVESELATTPSANSTQQYTPDNPCSIFGSNAKPARNSSNKTLGPDYHEVKEPDYSSDNPCSIFGSNAKPAGNSSNKTLGPDYQDIEGANYQ